MKKALDGNPVPNSTTVPVLWVGAAEQISVLVRMNHPGVWIVGDLEDDDRRHGMGVIMECAGRIGKPRWLYLQHSSGTTRVLRRPARTLRRPTKFLR